jgi:hypothetical protein
MFLLLIFLYGMIITIETIALKKERNKGKIILYLTLSGFAMIISGLMTLGIEIPSPSDLIKNVVTTIFG